MSNQLPIDARLDRAAAQQTYGPDARLMRAAADTIRGLQAALAAAGRDIEQAYVQGHADGSDAAVRP